MKFFSQSFSYDDAWSIVSLAYFLRYPNPYASHVISCDVISREHTPSGTLMTTRLILKRGNLPRWFPKNFVSRAESWLVEESEVDPYGKVVRCTTRNLDNLKVMRVEEVVQIEQAADDTTVQRSEVRIVSRFGWGLTKKIENFGVNRFKTNLQRSRDGISLIMEAIRQSRLQTMTMQPLSIAGHPTMNRYDEPPRMHEVSQTPEAETPAPKGLWTRLRGWWYPPS